MYVGLCWLLWPSGSVPRPFATTPTHQHWCYIPAPLIGWSDGYYTRPIVVGVPRQVTPVAATYMVQWQCTQASNSSSCYIHGPVAVYPGHLLPLQLINTDSTWPPPPYWLIWRLLHGLVVGAPRQVTPVAATCTLIFVALWTKLKLFD